MRPMILAAAVALTGAAWAQTAISPEDLAALEALKVKTGATPPALRPDELAELEAHRARLAAAEAAAPAAAAAPEVLTAKKEEGADAAKK